MPKSSLPCLRLRRYFYCAEKTPTPSLTSARQQIFAAVCNACWVRSKSAPRNSICAIASARSNTQPTGSDFESGFVLYKVLREIFPQTYANRMRFRFAPLVKLHLENQYPRASITTRLGRLNGRALYYGPFQSRTAAEKFMNDSLDFFKMRRCVDDLHPDPAFPGCIYSEMKMCLAPCFKGCTDEEYSVEVNRVQAYFDSGGESLAREFSAQRDAASANLAFEDAAAIHVRLEKLKPSLSQLPEIVRRLDRLSALIDPALPLAGFRHFLSRGKWSDLRDRRCSASKPPSTQSRNPWNREYRCCSIRFPPSKARTALETMEHLALLKRWYYRGRRIGEIFLVGRQRGLPHAPHRARHWPRASGRVGGR